MSVQHIHTTEQTTDTQFIFIRIIFIRVEIMRMTVKHTNHVSLSHCHLDFLTSSQQMKIKIEIDLLHGSNFSVYVELFLPQPITVVQFKYLVVVDIVMEAESML